jgi:hypothetical protein
MLSAAELLDALRRYPLNHPNAVRALDAAD